MSNKVNIRPNVSMLSVLKFLEYETWYALAEFVDNSIASFQKNEIELKELNGDDYKLKVIIEINDFDNKITIKDNAAGIDSDNYARAFRAAEVPPDVNGLSEFGMGMKSASCWFSDNWTVRTSALNEEYEKTVTFDMNKIIDDKVEELEYKVKPVHKHVHYTVIELCNVSKMPRKKGLTKVKSHLTSIYREFLRNNTLELIIDNTSLKFEEPKILNVPKYDNPNGEPVLWKKNINFEVDKGKLSVKGFVAIRETGSTSEAGFALFRRGRVIEGSFDSGFRPELIFGASNSYKYQRLFGELHLEGFDVSFTKKGIQWDENLEVFLECLKDEINSKEFPLLQQAENYRVRANDQSYKTSGTKALDQTASDFEEKAPKAIQEILEQGNSESESDIKLPEIDKMIHKEFQVNFNDAKWNISLQLSYESSNENLVEIGDNFIQNETNDPSVKNIGIRLSLVHPFMVQYVGTDNTKIEPILRLVATFGLSEVIAKASGAKTQGEIRRNINELINKLSSK